MALMIRMSGWIDFWIINPSEEKLQELYKKPLPENCDLIEALNDINDRIKSNIDAVNFVTADGEELEFILRNFIGIRYVKDSMSVTWTGDDARFIIGNLPVQNIC